MGLFPHAAAASVLQGSWAVASVIVEMLALGGLNCFPVWLWLFLHALLPPPTELAAPTPYSWLLLSQGHWQLWARWGPLVAEQWSPRTLGRAHWPREERACPRAHSVAT